MSTPWERLLRGGYGPPAGYPEVSQIGVPNAAGVAVGRTGGVGGAANTTESPRLTRFRQLVAQGLIDPNNVTDPTTGRIRTDVWALLDERDTATEPPAGPGYRFLDQAAGPGAEFRNPAEVREAQWERDYQTARDADLVKRSGMYTNPVTGQTYATADYGNQLLDRFGNARAAEDRYRAQLAQANAGVMGANQNVLAAQAAYNAAKGDVRMTGGGYNPTSEQQAALQAAGTTINQAQMAYNRAAGAGGQVDRPITVADIGRGMTEEQIAAAGQAAQAGYDPDEWARLMAGGGKQQGVRFNPALDYRRAAQARGIAF